MRPLGVDDVPRPPPGPRPPTPETPARPPARLARRHVCFQAGSLDCQVSLGLACKRGDIKHSSSNSQGGRGDWLTRGRWRTLLMAQSCAEARVPHSRRVPHSWRGVLTVGRARYHWGGGSAQMLATVTIPFSLPSSSVSHRPSLIHSFRAQTSHLPLQAWQDLLRGDAPSSHLVEILMETTRCRSDPAAVPRAAPGRSPFSGF